MYNASNCQVLVVTKGQVINNVGWVAAVSNAAAAADSNCSSHAALCSIPRKYPAKAVTPKLFTGRPAPNCKWENETFIHPNKIRLRQIIHMIMNA